MYKTFVHCIALMVTYILCQYTLNAPHDTDGEESTLTWTSSKSKQMKGVDELRNCVYVSFRHMTCV